MIDRSLMYQESYFVLLMPGMAEEILTAEELRQRLEEILSDRQANLPRDLAKFRTVAEQVQYLIDNACDFELEPGQTVQWFAIRLEKWTAIVTTGAIGFGLMALKGDRSRLQKLSSSQLVECLPVP